MNKIGRNEPCPCGSGKKYKKCCFGKKPRENIVMIGSPERLRGFHYDKNTMEITGGLTIDGRLIKLPVTFSQTQYKSDSGKEKVLNTTRGSFQSWGTSWYHPTLHSCTGEVMAQQKTS
jgi:hypothetical protein